MASVACPSCGGKGSIPDDLVGKKIKCQKCGLAFQAIPATVEVPFLDPGRSIGTSPRGQSIEVDGLDASTWAATAVSVEAEPHHAPEPPTEEAPASPPSSPDDEAPHRHYKILTQRDRFFEGKFDLTRLEDALNYYAGQGWVVRAMLTPHVSGFSGGPREEIVVLLER